MKSSQVFVLFVGMALLTVNLALADGEEATVAVTEASPTATDSSVPPSSQEAGGTAPPQREKEYLSIDCDYGCSTTDTATYKEITDTRTGKCIRILHTDSQNANYEKNECIRNCPLYLYGPSNCRENCAALHRPTESLCESGLSWGAIAGIIIGVILVIVIAGVCIICCLQKKRRGFVNGQPFQNVGQPAGGRPAAPPGYANQAPPPYANQPPTTAPSAYVNQAPAAPSTYAYQPPAAPQGYANQAPPAYAYQAPTAPNG